MLANGTHHSNGVHATQLYPACPSDYEAVTLDVTPTTPPIKGNWRDQLAPVTWSLSYTDSSDISHSCTVRGDTEEEVLAMVKPIVAGVRKSKQMAKDRAPQQAESELNAETDVKRCPIHGIDMPRRFSKRNNGHFFAHTLPDNTFCYGSKGHSGRERKAQ